MYYNANEEIIESKWFYQTHIITNIDTNWAVDKVFWVRGGIWILFVSRSELIASYTSSVIDDRAVTMVYLYL